ncbi:hypothetical protein ASPZODRAFT_2129701 [Penicilliopsis zonata CBS 506.65]|uniref:Dienelactone hydrolase domain-containing protein n=1 Tax=Penicilliopsis zonata CBS 506.65 TaxID=1073090 RepID=A0A1L9SHH2_9EURO|nr:hypothetical protein ASPZODRAFT_2129701 [Penicilliopsis zonata CBS 506.65]OJJ46563.1 hypothetical protein ASPZODRAFT_2129701 [Penicilliopsis zonata CBS 506.65]
MLDITGTPGKKALLLIYDIFAFSPLLLQGADILASTERLAIIPGAPCANPEWFLPGNEAGQEARAAFFATTANSANIVPRIAPMLAGLEEKYPAVDSVGSSLRRRYLADADAVMVPMAVLASGDENADILDEYIARLPRGSQLTKFPEMIHGWMSARGKLAEPEVKRGFEAGYQIVLDFLKETS